MKESASFKDTLETLLGVTSFAGRLGLFIGYLCVAFYFAKIGFLPQELSIGDGILLFLSATFFGLVYVVFTISFLSLGITAFYLPLQILVWIIERIGKVKTQHELAPISFISVVFSFLAVFLIYLFDKKDETAYRQLIFLSLALYFVYSIYLSINKQINNIINSNKSFFAPIEENPGKLRKIKHQLLCCILFLPLAMGGVSGQLLEGAMRVAQIRIDNPKPIIFVKEPYSSLLPKNRALFIMLTPRGYTPFINMTILFKGFGKTTVVGFDEKHYKRKIEILNDCIIVERL